MDSTAVIGGIEATEKILVAMKSGGVSAVMVVLLWRVLPVLEMWVRTWAGKPQRRDRRETDRLPSRVNGTPCSLHSGLDIKLAAVHDDLQEIKATQGTDMVAIRNSIEVLSRDLYPRMGRVEQDVAWIRGKLDRD